MKKLLLIASMVLCSNGYTQSDVSVSFDIVGGLQLWNGSYTEMDIDLNFGTNTLAVNGTLITPAGLSSPATGTCFFTTSGGVYCNLQVDHLSVNVSLEANLSGTISVKDAGGNILDVKPIQVFRG